nr:MAG TPA: hypothetical protein [Caudoviricetes sp.]
MRLRWVRGLLGYSVLDALALRALAPMMTPMVSAMALMVVAAGSAHVHPHTGPSACTSVAMAGSTISATHLSTSYTRSGSSQSGIPAVGFTSVVPVRASMFSSVISFSILLDGT